MEKAALALGYGGVGQAAAHGTGVEHASASCGHAEMVGARPGAWRPRRQTVEHMASVRVDMVGSQFGPLPGRIRPWAKNEVCSPQSALHFSLRHSSHLSNITVGNLISKVALLMH